MVDIHGQPFLDILIKYVCSFGFKRFILCSGYKSEVISKYYSKKEDGIEYVFSKEEVPLGTGGALVQAKKFHEVLGITGITVTKLDGSAKGGILFAIASQLPVGIRFIGIGEGVEDMQPFRPKEFVNALLTSSDED